MKLRTSFTSMLGTFFCKHLGTLCRFSRKNLCRDFWENVPVSMCKHWNPFVFDKISMTDWKKFRETDYCIITEIVKVKYTIPVESLHIHTFLIDNIIILVSY